MKTPANYLEINKKSWNDRVETHYKSAFYDMQGFMNGKTSLQEIELGLLGNIQGKSILHLQCHFGQDTLSLSRMGAEVTGVDFSEKAITKAKELAEILQSTAQFVCSDIYDLPQHLHKKFDMVFTSYGTIGWLPDLNKWAEVVNHFLKPNGTFLMVEFHPFVWMYDDKFEKITYDYFNTTEIYETEEGTYADKKAKLTLKTVSWNHALSEVINNLITHHIQIDLLHEYDFSPYPIFHQAVETASRRFQLTHIPYKLPLVYAISGSKKQ